jgi:hypothetical protein
MLYKLKDVGLLGLGGICISRRTGLIGVERGGIECGTDGVK